MKLDTADLVVDLSQAFRIGEITDAIPLLADRLLPATGARCGCEANPGERRFYKSIGTPGLSASWDTGGQCPDVFVRIVAGADVDQEQLAVLPEPRPGAPIEFTRRWEQAGEPAAVTRAALAAACARLAAGLMLMNVGLVGRERWTVDSVLAFLDAPSFGPLDRMAAENKIIKSRVRAIESWLNLDRSAIAWECKPADAPADEPEPDPDSVSAPGPIDLGQVPPGGREEDVPHERAVVGALLVRPQATRDALQRVGLLPEHVYHSRHREVLQAAMALLDRGEPVDPATIDAELQARGTLEQVGGMAFVVELLELGVEILDPAHHARRVLELALQRDALGAAHRVAQAVYSTGDVSAALAQAQGALQAAGAARGAEALAAARALVEGLPERARVDPGAPFQDEVVAALALLKTQDRAAWIRARAALKGIPHVRLGELEEAMKARVARAHQLATPATGPSPAPGPAGASGVYSEHGGRLTWLKDENTDIPLCNFTGRIVARVEEDDGDGELRSALDLKLQVAGRAPVTVSAPADRFSSLTWVDRVPGAILEPGGNVRDRVRHALQVLSGFPPTRRVYRHTGWTQLASGEWVYLHAGGAIGASGSVPGVEVALPPFLASFLLPDPPRGEELVRAVRASLGILRVAPYRVSLPGWAAVWRAPIGRADFSLFLWGKSGLGKSEEGALLQQHWGPAHLADKLPGSWTTTENALEAQAHACKDALLVVDDFKPTGDPAEDRRLHQKADRLLRAQANGAGRGRLRRDSTFMTGKAPRGMILTTGEELPRGESLRARMMAIELRAGEVDFDPEDGHRKGRLSLSQADGAAGLFAAAMAGYVRWLAPRIEQVQAGWSGRVVALRSALTTAEVHRRTSEIAADLFLALETFCQFAEEVGALEEPAADQLLADARGVLLGATQEQAELQIEVDPVDRFRDLLRGALISGRAHVSTGEGGWPVSPSTWGWRRPRPDVDVWQPMGTRVGWLEGPDLFLLHEVAAGVAGQSTDQPLGLSAGTLARRVHDRGLTVSARGKRALAQRRFAGGQVQVLHLRASWLAEGGSLPGGDKVPCPRGQPAPPAVSPCNALDRSELWPLGTGDSFRDKVEGGEGKERGEVA